MKIQIHTGESSLPSPRRRSPLQRRAQCRPAPSMGPSAESSQPRVAGRGPAHGEHNPQPAVRYRSRVFSRCARFRPVRKCPL
jgi:hypothetical protein